MNPQQPPIPRTSGLSLPGHSQTYASHQGGYAGAQGQQQAYGSTSQFAPISAGQNLNYAGGQPGNNPGQPAPLAGPQATTANAPASGAAAAMTSTDQVVYHHLQKRGYQQPEEFIRSVPTSLATMTLEKSVEQGLHARNITKTSNKAENTPDMYEESYARLRRFIESSLDKYRNELATVLWPVFVYVFLDMVTKGFVHEASRFLDKHRREHELVHGSEIQSLFSISTPNTLAHNEVASAFLAQKVEIQLSSFSHHLLISFVEESMLMLLLRLINDHLHLKIVSRKPLTLADMEEGVQMQSRGPNYPASQANTQSIHWGTLPFMDQLQRNAQKMQDDAFKAAATAESKTDGPAPMAIDSSPSRAAPRVTEPPSTTAAPRIPVPPSRTVHASAIPLPEPSEQVTATILEDLRKRVAVSATSLPSISLYTFLNTQDIINSVAVGSDASAVAAACADSVVRVWDLSEPRTFSDSPLDVNEEDPKAPCTQLVGHSGPIFRTSFSFDNRFLLSASEDTSIRLWSIPHKTCLVAYKGHNFPVWDVEFSPLGFYFASAAADRTARLWSTDKIYPLRIFAGHLSDIDTLKFHPNCNYLATGSTDTTVRLWDVQTGDCVRLLHGHSEGVRALAFSPDGKMLASAGSDRRIIIWDLAMGRKLSDVPAHDKDVTALDFSMEGSLLCSGSLDYSVKLWNTKTADAYTTAAESVPELGSAVKTFRTKNTSVLFTKFTPRNLLLCAGIFHP